MEILYLWIEDDGVTIKNQSFNFSNQINFAFAKTGANSGTLTLSPNPTFISNFFGEELTLLTNENEIPLPGRIVNVTGIIGENGVGKTNLLYYIIDLLTDQLPLNERHLIVFKDHKSNQIKTFHTLKEFKLTVEGNIEGLIIEQPIEQTYRIFEVTGSVSKNPRFLVDNFGLILYSPLFDLRNYPHSLPVDEHTFIDVSTNALIAEDNFNLNSTPPDDVDKVIQHKYSNIRRQLEFYINLSLTDIPPLNLPDSIEIIFHRSSFDPKNNRNLTFESEEIYKDFEKAISEEWSKLNSLIHSFESKEEDEKSSNQTYIDRQNPNYIICLVEKLKVEFIYCFIHNFFYNLDYDYQIDIGIKLEDIQGSTLYDRANYFFSNHKLKDSTGEGIVKSANLFMFVMGLINETDFIKYPINKNSHEFSTELIKAITLLSNYEAYLTSLPNDHKRNFISFNWRNISSGENALMDLFSRLLFAKTKRLKPGEIERGAKRDFIYILIDEGEVGFHPQWQSDYLFNLLKFIAHTFPEYLVQIILTSHSPFLVSDLPKNNLIFLTKEDNRCKVVSFAESETFASNIYSLFSNKFFMKDGVIGKFAREKLSKELKPLLDEKNMQVDHERLTKIIQMIGEPVLKEKLLDILKSKISK